MRTSALLILQVVHGVRGIFAPFRDTITSTYSDTTPCTPTGASNDCAAAGVCKDCCRDIFWPDECEGCIKDTCVPSADGVEEEEVEDSVILATCPPFPWTKAGVFGGELSQNQPNPVLGDGWTICLSNNLNCCSSSSCFNLDLSGYGEGGWCMMPTECPHDSSPVPGTYPVECRAVIVCQPGQEGLKDGDTVVACRDCSWGTYSSKGVTCLDCSGIPLGPGGSTYARDKAVGCSNQLNTCIGKSISKSTDGGSQGHFCCVSGTDGLYSLDEDSGKCSSKPNLCRVEGTGVGGGGNCDVSGCHEKLKTAAARKTISAIGPYG